MKTDTARMVGSAVMVDSAASTSTTSAPMLPPAASPSKRTRSTLSHTTTWKDNASVTGDLADDRAFE